ncbi:hypothetical protein KC19_2G223400 [Ceratodon purpureus]|uniref:Uncharacterized protein n=1 Tax=Ceratodon purpureus TaxID=3225 RepID=A0A8T0IZM7_CERPU|nr:hypothetical protein KC19_2G223400 [Ceratodon purpureus]
MERRNVALPGGECLIAGEAGQFLSPIYLAWPRSWESLTTSYAPKFPPLYTKRDFLVPDKYNWPYA